MGVISVRLNAREEKMINYLIDHFEEERSSLIKRSLVELYEDLKDRELIEEFESKERRGRKCKFFSSEEALKRLEK
jgi:hypothetical protein